MQTNGTLLDDSLLDLFAQYHVSLGVSLDGPAEYHDAVRPFRGGKPTHGRIMDALSRARKRGINVGILMSIGRGNARYVPQMFHFCREHGFDFGLNPVTRDLHAAHPESEVTPSVYLEACKAAFDLWFYQADAPIQVNPGCGVMRHLLSRARLSDCSMCDNCQLHFVSVGPEGDVYPCNRFYAVPGYTFGNISSESLQKILTSPTRAHLLARSADRIDHCRECSIRSFCNGGCMHHALAHFQRLDAPDHLCEVYRGLVEHTLARLSEVL